MLGWARRGRKVGSKNHLLIYNDQTFSSLTFQSEHVIQVTCERILACFLFPSQGTCILPAVVKSKTIVGDWVPETLRARIR